MNIEKAALAMRGFLEALDIDLNGYGMEKTPMRVAKMYARLFEGVGVNTKDIWGETFEGGDGMVAVRHLPFYSVCEHHLVPFFGEVDIVYLPTEGKIAGFSKFTKLIEVLSHRPQLQERLTGEIADAVYNDLSAKGALVVVSAKQLCMTIKRELAHNAKTLTSAMRGDFQKDENLSRDAWRLLGKEKS